MGKVGVGNAEKNTAEIILMLAQAKNYLLQKICMTRAVLNFQVLQEKLIVKVGTRHIVKRDGNGPSRHPQPR